MLRLTCVTSCVDSGPDSSYVLLQNYPQRAGRIVSCSVRARNMVDVQRIWQITDDWTWRSRRRTHRESLFAYVLDLGRLNIWSVFWCKPPRKHCVKSALVLDSYSSHF